MNTTLRCCGVAVRMVLPLCLIGFPTSWAAEPSDLDFTLASSLPDELVDHLRATPGHESYALAAWLNPFYLQADFDGDGRSDIAVLVREKATDKRGVLVVHFGTARHFVLGAGNELGNGGDDFSWMDAWHTQTGGIAGHDGGERAGSPPLPGAALVLIKTESASGLVHWTGTGYAWRQHAD